MFRWRSHEPTHRTEQRERVLAALADYRLYAPPDWNPDIRSLYEANVEYKKYFFDNRTRRLEALSEFLAKFNAALGLDDRVTSNQQPLSLREASQLGKRLTERAFAVGDFPMIIGKCLP